MNKEPPKFIADEMNGDLARWLRIMGFDCLYIQGENLDNKIFKLALESGRIVLTGDRELYRRILRKGGKAILTLGKNLEEKFVEIKRNLDLLEWINKLPHRCSICNSILTRISSKDAPDLPPSVRERFSYVWYCRHCKKSYWEGSHWQRIKETLKRLLK